MAAKIKYRELNEDKECADRKKLERGGKFLLCPGQQLVEWLAPAKKRVYGLIKQCALATICICVHA